MMWVMERRRGFHHHRTMHNTLLSLLVWAAIGLLLLLVWAASTVSTLLFGWWDRDRRIVHACVVRWARAVVALNPYWALRVESRTCLEPRRAYVFVANHQSLADVVVLPHIGVAYKCFSKSSLFRIPFLGWTLSLSRHIPLERGSIRSTRRAMAQARGWIARGMPVAFFAEGTRSRTGALQPFRAGAFRLAIETGTPVVPLAIGGTWEALPRGSWRFRHAVQGTLTILPPIETDTLSLDDVEAVRQRAFEAIAAALGQPVAVAIGSSGA